MYKADPKLYNNLFKIISDAFGENGRGYLATFEKGCLPRLGSDLIPDLFPWAFLTIMRYGRRLTEGDFYRSGRQAWHQSVMSLSVIGMSKDGDIAKLIANPDFDGDPMAQPPGLADITGQIMDYMYVNHQPASLLEGTNYQIPRWDAGGVVIGDDAIIRKAAPEAEYNNLAEYLGACRVDFTFDIIEYF